MASVDLRAPLIAAEGITKSFVARRFSSGHDNFALRSVDLVIQQGETVGLVGESGSGKTTLGRIMVRLLEPSGGTLHFDGEDVTQAHGQRLRALRREMQIVFQDPSNSLNPRMKVAELVGEPLSIHRVGTAPERTSAVEELLRDVGLPPSAAGRYPHELSGGQQQRVGIARALALKPRFLVADEPVSALDVSVQAQVLNLMRELKARFGLTYLFISHDIAVISYMSDRVVVLYGGEVVETGPTQELLTRPMHPYTLMLVASAQPLADSSDELMPASEIDGALGSDDLPARRPDVTGPSEGCVFVTRCPFRRPLCTTLRPELVMRDTGREVACHFADEVAANINPRATRGTRQEDWTQP